MNHYEEDYRRGNVIVLSAPSGAGKTTLAKRLLSEDESVTLCVSHTTRAPREGEVDHQDYTFIGEEEFRKMIEADAFVEWAEVHGNLYGTARRRLEAMLDEGLDVLLDIDVQGARSIKKMYPDGLFVFVLPPSFEVLESRLRGRGTDPEEVVARRLENAIEEIRAYGEFDYVILNKDLERAYGDLCAIVVSGRLRSESADHDWIMRTFLSGQAKAEAGAEENI